MPTVSTVTLDTLLDRNIGRSSSLPSPSSSSSSTAAAASFADRFVASKQPFRGAEGGIGYGQSGRCRDEVRAGSGGGRRGDDAEVRKANASFYYISPALYATPEPERIARASPASVSPSPYVVNYKRRDARWVAMERKVDQATGGVVENRANGIIDDIAVKGESGEGADGVVGERKVEEEAEASALDSAETADEGHGCDLEKEEIVDDEIDDFFNPRGLSSVMSGSDIEDEYNAGPRASGKTVANQTEFFDAAEDFISENSSPRSSVSRASINVDIRSVRLSLLEESEKRKKAEQAVAQLQDQWKRLTAYFSHIGVSFPPIPDGKYIQCEVDPIDQVCQELLVSQFVSEAIDRGLARAEIEVYAEAAIESKNHEISRLNDRLQYYEAVNREMSLRNQEAIELARQQRQKRRTRKRWVWSCIGLSVTVGASVLAHSYIAHANGSSTSCYQLSESSLDTIKSENS